MAPQDDDEEGAPAAAGAKRKGPDQGKLEEAVEREKAKKQKAKEDAAEKVGISYQDLRDHRTASSSTDVCCADGA